MQPLLQYNFKIYRDPTHIKIQYFKTDHVEHAKTGQYSLVWHTYFFFKTSVNVVVKFTTSRTTIIWSIYCVAMLNQTSYFSWSLHAILLAWCKLWCIKCQVHFILLQTRTSHATRQVKEVYHHTKLQFWMAGCLVTNKGLPVKVLYAVNLVCCIHSERNAIQTFPTNDTRKTLWMIRLPSGS